MKRKIILAIVLVVLLLGGFLAWQVFGPTVSSPEGKYFFIRTGSNYSQVKDALEEQKIISNGFFFDKFAKQIHYDKGIKPGRYLIKDGMSLYNLLRMLRSGRQAPVNLVITKLRTKEEFAQKIAANFETDSTSFIDLLNNTDTLKQYHLDSNTVMTTVIPNTYTFLWNSSASKIFRKLLAEKQKFWNEERLQKARELNMTPEQVYSMASIIEEETNKEEDKGNIASVYINRIAAGQRLEADPTIKFALRNFGLKRIRNVHKEASANSPYNTYYVKGLPPGPICTPSPKTIDAVLNAPTTNYYFFVARPDWSGLSNFAQSYQDHLINAKNYQHFLDSVNIK